MQLLEVLLDHFGFAVLTANWKKAALMEKDSHIFLHRK